MKPEERPGLGRKIVVTDEGIDPAVIEAIDKTPAKQITRFDRGSCGAILEVPEENNEAVPEFILALAADVECTAECRHEDGD